MIPTMSGLPGFMETPCTSTPGGPRSSITFAVRSAVPTELPPGMRIRRQAFNAASGGSRVHVLGPDHVPCGEDDLVLFDIVACLDHIFERRNRLYRLDAPGVNRLRVLEHHDSVRASRESAAGRD